jgi:hypothetical protein
MLVVVELVLESSVVMVVNKETQSIDIFEFGGFSAKCFSDLVHGLTAAKDIFDCEEHWVVEHALYNFLVWCNVIDVAIKALSHLKDSSRLCILCPKVLGYFWNRVDSDSVEFICIN